MLSLARVRSYAWAAPASAVGLLAALVAWCSGASIAMVDGVVEVAAPRLGRSIAAWPRGLRFDAITLGHVVIGASADILAHSRLHERVHVRQYERWGALFFALYAASSALQWLRRRDPYWENHFERQARRLSGHYNGAPSMAPSAERRR